MSERNDDPVMARRASAPDGKLTKHLDVMISEDMEESLIVLAKVHGYQNRSEFVRDRLHKMIYGEIDALMLLARAKGLDQGNVR